MSDTTQKLEKLLTKHTKVRPDFKEQLTGWEKKLKEAIATKKFGESDIMRTIRRGIARHIQEINEILLYKEELTAEERMRLIDKRGMYLSFLNLFRSADLTIENIDKALSFELGEGVDNSEE